MRQILMSNAFEAWTAAIRYCNDIKNGKATIQYQKILYHHFTMLLSLL